MKSITIAGNIGKDAQTRQAGSDKVTSFSVAVEHRAGREKTTMWFDVSIWGQRGEALSQYLTKGARVAVSGDFSTRDHDGKTYLQVRADQVTLMGGGERQETRQEQRPAPAISDDEIPF